MNLLERYGVQDEKLRRSKLVRVSRIGWKKDPKAVTAWLDKNEAVPAKVRQHILRGRRSHAAAPGAQRRIRQILASRTKPGCSALSQPDDFKQNCDLNFNP